MKKYSMLAAGVSLVFIFALTMSHQAGPALAQSENSAGVSKQAVEVPAVFQAAGPDKASIQSMVDAYRNKLGALNPNVPGSFGSGRREINWDGVPDAFSAPNNLPNDFFNVNSPRGAVFETPGTAVQVSADNDNPTNTPVRFANINKSFADTFSTFSPQRLFIALSSNITEVVFAVPGSPIPANTTGFGVIFTDVDFPAGNNGGRGEGSTRVEYFDAKNQLLFTSDAPASPGDAGFSFIGVVFSEPRVAWVRITSGNKALALEGTDGEGGRDLVAMDDFIYGEPQPIQ